MCCVLNRAVELLDLCDAVVGGRTCFSAALASLLKMLLSAWEQRYPCVLVLVCAWVYAGLCPVPEALCQSCVQGRGTLSMGAESLQRSRAYLR